jgi:hypothetical protein|nr:MAG TPA: winged helix-turn-helix domain protein [Caudoviricetes sp.]
MIKASDLQKVDFAILQYLHDHGKTKESDLPKALNKSAQIIKLRIRLLSTPDYLNQIPLENTSYVDKDWIDAQDEDGFDTYKYTGYVSINTLGEKVLEDSILAKKDDRKRYLVRSVLIPFAVSLVTAVLTTIATLCISKRLGPYL